MSSTSEVYTSDPNRAAVDYRKRGLSPIPLKRRSKEPKLPKGHPFLSRTATVEEFTGFDFRHNIGIVTGKISRIIVLDDDDGGETLHKNGWHVPPTPTVKTRRGHQYYFRCPEAGFPTCELATKVEVRGDGAYVVAPPSVHPSGTVYEWLISPDEAELADPPAWLLKQASMRGRRMQAEDVGEVIANGSRNKVLFSLAGTLRRRGLDEASIAAALLGINAVKCETPLPEDEVRKIAHSAARYDAAETLRGAASSDATDDGAEMHVNPLLANRVLLRKAMEDGIEPPDELEPGVLLKGKVHQIFAASGLGKTMLALWLTKRRIERGQRVIYLDDENGARTISERLQDMGVDSARVDEFLYYLPFPHLPMTRKAQRDFMALLEEVSPTLVVFDSWINFLAGAGLNENENTDIQVWSATYTKPAREMGITTAVLDHVPHEGARARGASRKKDEADVQWQLYRTKHFDRNSVGEITLHREKDRDDWLDPSVRFSVGGTDDGRLTFRRSAGTVEEPDPKDGLTDSARKLLKVLQAKFAATGAGASEWAKAAGLSRQTVYRSKDTLIARGLVREERRRYYPIDGPDGGGKSVTPDSDPQEDSVTPESGPGEEGVTLDYEEGVTPESGLDNSETPEVSHGVTPCNTAPDVTAEEGVTHCNTPLKGVTGVTPSDTFADNGSLSVDEAVRELRRPYSGPRINHPLYIADKTTLEILTRSVLTAMHRDPGTWKEAADVVAEAADDPMNHPVECECEKCS